MTVVLHIPAQLDAAIACDMSTAADAPDERLGDYGRLFERLLVRRERRAGGVVFSFRADGSTREAVEDLARREAACCPFLGYRVETVEDEVIWTISNPVAGDARSGVDVMLDAFHALPDISGPEFEGLLGRRADRGVGVFEASTPSRASTPPRP